MEGFLSQFQINRSRFCPKVDHENNRISFICTEDRCQSESRLGCAYCFLESHQDHVNKKLKIEVFEEKLEEKLRNLKVFYSEFSSSTLEKAVLGRIEADFEVLRLHFMKSLSSIQDNLVEFYRARMRKISNEKEKLDVYIGGISDLSGKKLMEMQDIEIDQKVGLFLNKNLEKIPKSFLKEFEEKETKIKDAIYSYLRDFRLDFDAFIRKLSENYGISALSAKLYDQKKESPVKNTKHLYFSRTFASNLSEIKENTTKKMHSNKRKGLSQYLKKNAKHFFEIFEKKSCEHISKAKIALIFPCCDRAFLCYRCHDKAVNDHQWDVKKDIRLGYCLKCYTILKSQEEKCSNCLIGLKS